MVRGLAKIAMVVTIAGCNLDTSGVGSAAPVGPGQGSLDGGTLDDGSAGEGETEGGDHSGGATSAPDGTADDGLPADSGAGHPVVLISDGPIFHFGSLDLGTPLEHSFVITNEGDTDATALQLGLTGSFVLQGNDCGETLSVGDACEVQVRFSPVRFGNHEGELTLGFEDAGVPASASRPLAGQGVGVTGNLVINGGGETGGSPPSGWQEGHGNWGTSTSASGPSPVEGNHTINGGWDWAWESDLFRLLQQVDGVVLTNWGDAAGVRFHFQASHRPASSNDDPTAVIFRFHASDGTLIQSYPSTVNSSDNWAEATGNWVAPSDTHFVQVELQCDRTGTAETLCNGYFDDVRVWAEWQG